RDLAHGPPRDRPAVRAPARIRARRPRRTTARQASGRERMRGPWRWVLVAALIGGSPAVASEDDPDAGGFTGSHLPKIVFPADPPPDTSDELPPELAAKLQGPPKYAARVYVGADALDLDPDFVNG